MEPIELREKDLLLRLWQAQDASEVHRACQDPLIQRWTGVPRPYTIEVATDFVTSHTERAWASGKSAPFGVFDATSGELLGSCGLVALDLAGATGEIGYWVAPWARRRGVATGAARAVARWCFHTLGLRRLDWQAEVGNHASRMVAIRLGVTVEGISRSSLIRPDGCVADAVVGSLLSGELLPDAHPHATNSQVTGPVGRDAEDAEATNSHTPIGHPAPADRTNPADRAVALRRAALFAAPQPSVPLLGGRNGDAKLRPPTEADLDAIVDACQDPESVRWTSVPHPYGRSDAEWFVHEQTARRWRRGSGAVFAIAGPDDKFMGSIELRIPPSDIADPAVARHAVGDVGFLVAPWARRRGYATAALRTLCAWSFSALALRRIEWCAYVGNDASRAVATGAGFGIEGLARRYCPQRGEYRDAWLGAILASDQATDHPTPEVSDVD